MDYMEEFYEIKIGGLMTKRGKNRLANELRLTFMAGVQIEDYIYFSAWNANGLFKMDPTTGECILLKLFEGEQWQNLHSAAVYYKDAIWLIPSNSKRITRVDIHTLEMSYILLPTNSVENLNSNGKKEVFKWGCCYKEGSPYLWLTPRSYNLLLRIDMEKQDIFVCDEFKENKIKYSDSKLIDDEIWMCPYDNTEGLVYHTVSGEKRRYPFDEKTCEYLNIQAYKNWMIFFPRQMDQAIILMDRHTFDKQYIYLNKSDLQCQTVGMSNGHALLVPYFGKKYIDIDFHADRILENYKLQNAAAQIVKDDEKYLTCMESGNHWIFLSGLSFGPTLQYKIETGEFSFIRIRTNQEKYEQAVIKMIETQGENACFEPLHNKKVEENQLSLRLFLALAKSDSSDGECRKAAVGEKIFHEMKLV